jgi:fructose-1,6-bisphosphatase/inositol monophosphatase family enzyme
MTDLVDVVSGILRSAAERAIVPRFRALEASAITEKGPDDWVTDADQEAEDIITSALHEVDPGVVVVGEEAVAADPDLLANAHRHERVWVLDPLDGTKAFIGGSEDFATMAALIEDGRTTAAWIWLPIHQRMFTALRGKGAQADGLPLTTPQRNADVGELRGVLRTRLMPPSLRSAALAGLDSAGLTHSAVAASGVVYPMMASGELTHALYWRTLPWDHAPGTLLSEEAGLVVGRLDGSEYSPWDGRNGLLTAANQSAWKTVRAALPADIEDTEPK